MTDDPNRHVREYLHYYVSKQRPPNYAVLVEGPWGIGKTFLVRKTLTNLPSVQFPNVPYPWRTHQEYEATLEARRWMHVSLFGIKSAAEFDVAILRAIYPILQNSRTQLLGSLAMGLLRALRYNPALQLTEVLSKFRPGTYVFDDLERCEMPLQSVLGQINQYVEHEDCKVVIIANEKELDPTIFARQKEKIIGKKLVVQLELEEALSEFVANVEDNGARKVLSDWSEKIALIFRQSKLGSLRVLQQTIWDFERVLPALSDKDRANKEAFETLFRLFFALSFELKGGRIDPDDLTDRANKIALGLLQKHRGDAMGKLADANARYPDISLDQTPLSDEVLVDILDKGIVDADAIKASIVANGYFARQSEPAWRTVWHFTERTADEVTAALQLMEQQFNNHEFHVPGEMLHVFALRMWLADEGGITADRAQARQQAIDYIDELYNRNALEPLGSRSADDDSSWHDSYGGLGIVQADSDDFKQIYRHLQAKRKAARERRYPVFAESLLSELATDPRLFVRRLVWNGADDTLYADEPVLAAIEPARFVETVLLQPVSDQRTILSVFRSRYDGGELNTVLKPEKEWLRAVNAVLLAKIADAPFATRIRLKRLVDYYIARYVD